LFAQVVCPGRARIAPRPRSRHRRRAAIKGVGSGERHVDGAHVIAHPVTSVRAALNVTARHTHLGVFPAMIAREMLRNQEMNHENPCCDRPGRPRPVLGGCWRSGGFAALRRLPRVGAEGVRPPGLSERSSACEDRLRKLARPRLSIAGVSLSNWRVSHITYCTPTLPGHLDIAAVAEHIANKRMGRWLCAHQNLYKIVIQSDRSPV
jgi:hypothetical protein